MVEQLFDRFIGALADFGDGIVSTVTGRIGDVVDGVRDIVNGVERRIVQAVDGVASTASAAITTATRPILTGVTSAIRSILETSATIESRLLGIADSVRSVSDTVLSGISDTVLSPIEAFSRRLESLIQRLLAAIGGAIDGTIAAAASTAETVASRVADAVTSGIEGVTTTLGSIPERFEAVVSVVREEVLPRLAEFGQQLRAGLGEVGQQLRDSLLQLPFASLGSELPMFARQLDDVLRRIEDDPDVPDDIKALLAPGLPVPLVIVAAIVIFVLPAVIGPFLQATYTPALQSVQQRALRTLPTSLLTPAELQEAWRRGLIDDTDFTEQLRRQGFNSDKRAVLRAMSQQFLAATDYIVSWQRGEMPEAELDAALRRLGIGEEDIGRLKQLAFPLPNIPDLVRMAVREVFTPEISRRFGLQEDFPEAFEQLAQRVGVTPEIARWYWAAHWELPSATMGFEMFHRGIIGADDLKLLLRALDVMPFWRDRLIQLSYNPLTRVDVRRMYSVGVLNRQQVERAYLDLGYSPENAKRLTEFTVRLGRADDETDVAETRQLTRSQIERFYRRGLLSRDEALSMLQDMGYSEDAAELILTLQDLDLAEQDQQEQLQLVQALVEAGELSVNDAIAQLDAMEVAPAERARLLARIERAMASRVKLPSKDMLDEMYRYDVITREEYVDQLVIQGYSELWAERLAMVEDAKRQGAQT